MKRFGVTVSHSPAPEAATVLANAGLCPETASPNQIRAARSVVAELGGACMVEVFSHDSVIGADGRVYPHAHTVTRVVGNCAVERSEVSGAYGTVDSQTASDHLADFYAAHHNLAVEQRYDWANDPLNWQNTHEEALAIEGRRNAVGTLLDGYDTPVPQNVQQIAGVQLSQI